MYFKYFNTFSYNLNFKNYDYVNIFKKVVFSNRTLNSKKIFSDYYVIDGDTIENIARKFYDDPGLSWFILICNNFTNRDEFPQSIDLIEQTARNKYPGSSLYFYEYIPDMRAGDVLVKCTVSGETITSVDTSKYGVVQEYNSVLRYAIVTENKGLTFDDYVTIKRSGSNSTIDVNYQVVTAANASPVTRNFVQIKRITNATDSPVEFLNLNGNYLSPYYVNDTYEVPSNTIGIYTTVDLSDNKTVRNTTLNTFINNPSVISYKSIFGQFLENNNKNRIIKIMKPVYLQYAFEVMQELLTNDNIRTKTIDIAE
jgi:hypothetical protein